ncbi:unnamed protein product [Mytilus edulis]|uniref:Uncharacterized protein n=1 Tax=Mytilus edulis TaxID=6550 RepID=A0A8S3T9X9_MYTED|nr:unnamed protein product [Mytilus edulis]
MDDSDVISFKPHLDNREDDEETLPENNFESSSVRMSGSEGETDRIVVEARLEMRRFLDQCMLDFTNRLQEMLSNFETRLVSTISCKTTENSSRDVVSSPTLSRERDDISNNSNLVDSDRSNVKYELSFESINTKATTESTECWVDNEWVVTNLNRSWNMSEKYRQALKVNFVLI